MSALVPSAHREEYGRGEMNKGGECPAIGVLSD